MFRFTIAIAALALALGGCKKKDGDAADKGGSAAAKTTDKPKVECAPNAMTNPDGPYCIQVPADYPQVPPREVAGDQLYEYKKGDQVGVDVSLGKYPGDAASFPTHLDMEAKMLAGPDKKNLQVGDLPGGNGKYWSYEDSDGLWSESKALSSKGLQVQCNVRESATDSNPEKQALLDACKTLVVQ